MNKILWHAVSKGALIRSQPAKSAPVLRSVTNGIWLGVIKEFGEWIYVIGKESTGWVTKKELSLLETNLLHIKKSEDDMLRVGYSI